MGRRESGGEYGGTGGEGTGGGGTGAERGVTTGGLSVRRVVPAPVRRRPAASCSSSSTTSTWPG